MESQLEIVCRVGGAGRKMLSCDLEAGRRGGKGLEREREKEREVY